MYVPSNILNTIPQILWNRQQEAVRHRGSPKGASPAATAGHKCTQKGPLGLHGLWMANSNLSRPHRCTLLLLNYCRSKNSNFTLPPHQSSDEPPPVHTDNCEQFFYPADCLCLSQSSVNCNRAELISGLPKASVKIGSLERNVNCNTRVCASRAAH